MAAPHVAGAWALLEERDPWKTVNNISYALEDTGKLVKDTRAGGTATGSRINIAEAANVRPLADDFGSPKSLSGATFSVPGINEAATRESDEPDHLPADSASLGENSVWYSWTAPFSGPVTMDTCQANISSTIAVYTGSELSTLSRVADNRYACPSALGSKVTFDATAGTTYRIAVAEPGGDHTQNTFTLDVGDRKPPTVTRTSPADNATGIARGADLKATFSEGMQASSINANTFELRRAGSTTNVAAAVSYDLSTRTATLNPNTNLKTGATYLATLTTGAKDLAGNGLDQDPNTAGNQPKSWKFTVQ
jgi:hypothetical protein